MISFNKFIKRKCEKPFFTENIIDELLPTLTFDKITHVLENCPALVIFGQNTKAKASLVNHILSMEILPVCTGQWRWIKIACGTTNHVNLTLGLEYEVVDNLLANEKPWVTIPVEDLIESGSKDANCPTVLEVKLNQPTLKDGVQIFVVPDTGWYSLSIFCIIKTSGSNICLGHLNGCGNVEN